MAFVLSGVVFGFLRLIDKRNTITWKKVVAGGVGILAVTMLARVIIYLEQTGRL